MLIKHPAVQHAAVSLFGRGSLINSETISKFEQVYNCKINTGDLSLIPSIKFNTEQDEIVFLLRWS